MAAATRSKASPARWRAIGLVITLLLGIGLAIRITTPIAAQPADAPATNFSAGRAMREIDRIGVRPHPVGSAEHDRVRGDLAAELAALGLAVSIDSYPVTEHGAKTLARWSGKDASRIALANVVGVWPGRDRSAPALVLMAHYDTVWGSPGAADDSAGVATILEDVRAMKAAGLAPARDLIVLLTDGEEIGLAGAERFFADDPLARHVGFVVNHETRGGGGRTTMFETGPGDGAAMRLFARSVPHPSVNSMSVLVYRAMPNSTDLTVALGHGINGYNFAFTGRPRLYHSPLATPSTVEAAAIQDMGDQSFALVRALAVVPALPSRDADAAFSDLLGLVTIGYAPAWGWSLIAAAALMLGAAVRRAAGTGALEPGEFVGGLVTAVLLPALAAPMLVAANLLSQATADPNYYDRLAALPGLETQAALLCVAALLGTTIARVERRRWLPSLALLALGAVTALLGGSARLAYISLPAAAIAFVRPRRPVGPQAGWFGLILLLLVAAATIQALAPTAAPLFEWPVLVACAAALTAVFDPAMRRLAIVVPVAILLGAALGQALAFGHFVFEAIGAPMPVVAIPFLMIAAMLVRPLLGAPRPAVAGAIAVALATIAIGIALRVRLDPLAASVPLYSLR